MSLLLAAEEPEAGPWRAESLAAMVTRLLDRGYRGARPGDSLARPFVLAVDGRSNNGKTTLSRRVCALVPGSVAVHTDDIAWNHSRFGWSDLLIDGVLEPLRRGRADRYQPPRWAEHGRAGSIDVPADCPLLVVEGDGAGRREVSHLLDALIWVQSDEREAAGRQAGREIDRPPEDLANAPVNGMTFDNDGWMAEEIPFNAGQRTWERADVVVCGTPEIAWDPATEVVVAPPPGTRERR